MLTVHNFTYGLLPPALAYVMSCLGAFIGLRCTTRAYAYEGRARANWLAAAAVALGTTGGALLVGGIVMTALGARHVPLEAAPASSWMVPGPAGWRF